MCEIKASALKAGEYPVGIEHYKCRKCDGFGNYEVGGMPRMCKDYPIGPEPVTSLTVAE
ncbi:MAG: hypothetical protein QW548_01535 [Candidatus Aenigmatarchaeota archaeon]